MRGRKKCMCPVYILELVEGKNPVFERNLQIETIFVSLSDFFEDL